MKFTATQSALVEALTLVSRAVPSRPVHPILGNVLMTLEGDRLTLTGFDLTLGIKTTIAVEGKEDGVIAVPSRTLGEIISRLPSGAVKLETGEDTVLHVKAAKGKYKLSWLVPEEYPLLPVIEEGQSLTLKASELATAIRNVTFAASNNETKQILVGVRFRLLNEGLELAATDGHRLATTLIERPHAENETIEQHPVELTIQAKSLGELNYLLKGLDGADVEMIFDQSQALFKIGDRVLTTRVLEGDYPVVEQLIPDRFNRMVAVSRRELIAVLERLSVLVPENKKDTLNVKFNITGSAMILTSDGKDNNSGEEEIECLNTGEDILLAFNVKYALDALRVISGDEVNININEPTTPVTITPFSGTQKHTCLVMPVRITD